jgi:hypothetical protein
MRAAKAARSSLGMCRIDCQLLLSIGYAGWQWHYVPMHVCVALVASQCKQVYPLCAQLLAHGFRDVIQPSLEGKVLVDRKITCDLLSMLSRRN